MSKDIVPELLEKIEKEFKNKTAKSKIIKKKIIALKNKKVTHEDSNDFAIEVGKILSEAFSEEIWEDLLPDNRMYYNIAKRLIEPNLKRNFDIVGDYTRDVQEVLNKNSNLSLKAIKPEINQEKIDGIIGKISDYESFEEGKWLLREPIINFTQSIVDDLIKANADFQHRAGLSPKIVRKEAGGCCDWCRKLVGTYKYPEDVPADVWRRHRYCRCTVDYLPGDGKKKKQDVWSKQWTDVDRNDKINLRQRIALVEHSSSINIVKKVRSGEIDLTSNKEHYEKHLLGTNQFNQHLENRIKRGYGKQSILTISYEETQRLINEFYGRGIVQSTKSGKPRNQEDINFKMIIGYYVYEGKEYPTTKRRIHYGRKGTHIVPIKGDNFD